MAENEPKKQNNKKYLLFGIIVILAIINIVNFYLDYKDNKEKEQVISNKNEELMETYAKLETISKELEDKIGEIKELGGNVDSLVVIQKQLEQDKIQLKKSRNIATRKYEEIKDKLEGYEELLQQQDERIAKLEEVNKVLLEENTVLKTEKNKLSDSISNLSQTRNVLEEKVAMASVLKAENINVVAVSDKGKEKDGGEYKAKQLDKLTVSFNLAENKVAKIEGKEILLSIVDPNGSVLYDVANGSGTFIYDGKEQFYTAKQDILFDNTQQLIKFIYAKGSEYEKGKYDVNIYAEGYKIGSSTFVVK